jgi:hypothetical protein
LGRFCVLKKLLIEACICFVASSVDFLNDYFCFKFKRILAFDVNFVSCPKFISSQAEQHGTILAASFTDP